MQPEETELYMIVEENGVLVSKLRPEVIILEDGSAKLPEPESIEVGEE